MDILHPATEDLGINLVPRSRSYLGMYIGIIALDYVFRWSSFIIYLYGMMRASQKIHNSLIASILHATLR